MILTWFSAIAGSLFAIAGTGGIFIGTVATGALRERCFRIGCYAMTAGGLFLMVGGALGNLGAEDVSGGLMMLVFGSSLAWSRKDGKHGSSDHPIT